MSESGFNYNPVGEAMANEPIKHQLTGSEASVVLDWSGEAYAAPETERWRPLAALQPPGDLGRLTVLRQVGEAGRLMLWHSDNGRTTQVDVAAGRAVSLLYRDPDASWGLLTFTFADLYHSPEQLQIQQIGPGTTVLETFGLDSFEALPTEEEIDAGQPAFDWFKKTEQLPDYGPVGPDKDFFTIKQVLRGIRQARKFQLRLLGREEEADLVLYEGSIWPAGAHWDADTMSVVNLAQGSHPLLARPAPALANENPWPRFRRRPLPARQWGLHWMPVGNEGRYIPVYSPRNQREEPTPDGRMPKEFKLEPEDDSSIE